LAVLSAACFLCAGPAVFADWNENDEHKMHFPQLPDPDGWDVFAGPLVQDDGVIIQKTLADDWRCSETGYVSDVHIWGSWKHDDIGVIHKVHLSIHEDVPVGADPNVEYSHPGELLWQGDFSSAELVIRDYGSGDQGWYNPNTNEFNRPDHQMFHQINITDIPKPFVQEQGKIYWLDVTVETDPVQPGTDGPQWGWKTTLEHFNDDAVWGDSPAFGESPTLWNELREPSAVGLGESLDLAFVITGKPVPEPASGLLILMGLSGLALVTRRPLR
jgi:hypothetical protein